MKWKATVKLRSGRIEEVSVEAFNYFNAKEIIEHQTGGIILSLKAVSEPVQSTPASSPSNFQTSDGNPVILLSFVFIASVGALLAEFYFWNGGLQALFRRLSEIIGSAFAFIMSFTVVAASKKLGFGPFRVPHWLADYIVASFFYATWYLNNYEDEDGEGNLLIRFIRSVFLWPLDLVVLRPFRKSGSAGEFLKEFLKPPVALFCLLLVINALIWINSP